MTVLEPNFMQNSNTQRVMREAYQWGASPYMSVSASPNVIEGDFTVVDDTAPLALPAPGAGASPSPLMATITEDENNRMVGKARGDMEAPRATGWYLAEVITIGEPKIEDMEGVASESAGLDFARCEILPHGIVDWTPGVSFGPFLPGLFTDPGDVDRTMQEIVTDLTEERGR